jgi:hypothetical protein
MTTPVYSQFPAFPVTVTGSKVTVTPAGTYSGILHTVVIGKTTTGVVTIADNSGTIIAFQASTPCGSYLFDCSYAAPLSVTTTASEYLCVTAGPV